MCTAWCRGDKGTRSSHQALPPSAAQGLFPTQAFLKPKQKGSASIGPFPPPTENWFVTFCGSELGEQEAGCGDALAADASRKPCTQCTSDYNEPPLRPVKQSIDNRVEMPVLTESLGRAHSLLQVRRTKEPALETACVAVLEGSQPGVLLEDLSSGQQLTASTVTSSF